DINAISIKEIDTNTAHEMDEEARRFEMQKRQFEERANRLRQMTSQVSGTDNLQEIENMPSYLRKNIKMEENNTSSEISDVSTDGNPQKKGGLFNTINTFLQGIKPD